MTLEVTPVNRSAPSFESYYPALLERLRTLPGIAAAGAIDNLPLMGSSTGTQAHVDGAAIGVKNPAGASRVFRNRWPSAAVRPLAQRRGPYLRPARRRPESTGGEDVVLGPRRNRTNV